MIERLSLALPLFVLALMTLFAVRRRSPLEPSIILVAATALVGVFYPLGSALVRPLTWRHGAYLPDEAVLATQWQYLWFAIGVCTIVANVRWRRASADGADDLVPLARDASPGNRAAIDFRDLAIAGGLVVGGSLLYAGYVSKVGLAPLLDRSNFAEKYRVSSGLGTLYFGIHLVIFGCLWAEASALSQRWTRLFRALAAGVMVWSIAFVAVRTYAVALFLGYVYLACRKSEFSLARVRPWLIVTLGIGYIGVESYAMMRGAWQGSIVDAFQTIQREQKGLEHTVGQIVGGSELSHPFHTTMELAQFEEAGALGGASYADAVLGVLPVWLYPDRPPTPAQEFARRHYPSLDERGGGTAFSLVGEAWWNFGAHFGPLLVGLMLAFLLTSLERTARRDVDSVVARVQPYLVHMVILLHRGSAVSIAKQLFSLFLPVAVLALLAHLVWRALGDGREREPVAPFTHLGGQA